MHKNILNLVFLFVLWTDIITQLLIQSIKYFAFLVKLEKCDCTKEKMKTIADAFEKYIK